MIVEALTNGQGHCHNKVYMRASRQTTVSAWCQRRPCSTFTSDRSIIFIRGVRTSKHLRFVAKRVSSFVVSKEKESHRERMWGSWNAFLDCPICSLAIRLSFSVTAKSHPTQGSISCGSPSLMGHLADRRDRFRCHGATCQQGTCNHHPTTPDLTPGEGLRYYKARYLSVP